MEQREKKLSEFSSAQVMSVLEKEYSRHGKFTSGEKPPYPSLEDALDAVSSKVRLAAVSELERRKEKKSLPLLKSALSDWYVPVRATAIKALEAMGDTSAKERFISDANCDNFRVRFEALRVLAQLKDASLRPVFAKAMQSEDARISTLASEAMFSLGERNGLRSLISKLANGNSEEKVEAAGFLATIEDPEAQRAVGDFLNSNDVPSSLKETVSSNLRRARKGKH